MKVFVAMASDNYVDSLVGVYTTELKARIAIDNYKKANRYHIGSVREFEIDSKVWLEENNDRN